MINEILESNLKILAELQTLNITLSKILLELQSKPVTGIGIYPDVPVPN